MVFLPLAVAFFQAAAGGHWVEFVLLFVEPVFRADQLGGAGVLEAVRADQLLLPVERIKNVPRPMHNQGVERGGLGGGVHISLAAKGNGKETAQVA